MKLWGLEPAVITGFITAILATFVAFGIDVSTEKQEAIKNLANALIIIIGSIVIRQQVIPVAKVEAAHGLQGVRDAQNIKKAEIGTMPPPRGGRASRRRPTDYIGPAEPVEPPPNTPNTPRGGSGILILALALGLAAGGCSARSQGIALQIDRGVHGALATVQDTVDQLCDEKVMAPDQCGAFNRALVPALEAGQAYNRAVATQRQGELGPLVISIGNLTNAVTLLVPERHRPPILKRIQELLSAAFEEAGQ
jgi:hypothetical protein